MKLLLKDYILNEPPPKQEELITIDLLIGRDYYWDIIVSIKINITWGLYLIDSKLGWILTGRLDQKTIFEEEGIDFALEPSESRRFIENALNSALKNSRYPPRLVC